ncbi:hypothetical protein K1X76_09930 [bacterium]|nr:hypothetical protein [bacterium]
MNQQTTQPCSYCHKQIDGDARYPQKLCKECMVLLTDNAGRPVGFRNNGMMGTGCEGFYLDSKERYESSLCYIKNDQFAAQEHRFGGIVVEKVIKK